MLTLYDSDILLWSERQADLLRRLALGERVNEAMDWENLVEEVESVGRSQLQAVESLLDVALRHLLLAHGAPGSDVWQHWLLEAAAALKSARKRFTPSMAQRIDLTAISADAAELAARKLRAHGGPTREQPAACPCTLPQLLDPAADVDALLAAIGAAAP